MQLRQPTAAQMLCIEAIRDYTAQCKGLLGSAGGEGLARKQRLINLQNDIADLPYKESILKLYTFIKTENFRSRLVQSLLELCFKHFNIPIPKPVSAFSEQTVYLEQMRERLDHLNRIMRGFEQEVGAESPKSIRMRKMQRT